MDDRRTCTQTTGETEQDDPAHACNGTGAVGVRHDIRGVVDRCRKVRRQSIRRVGTACTVQKGAAMTRRVLLFMVIVGCLSNEVYSYTPEQDDEAMAAITRHWSDASLTISLCEDMAA